MGDPFAPLKTADRSDVAMAEHLAGGTQSTFDHLARTLATHRRVWDVGNTREVVALLELAEAHLHPTFGAWYERLDALLTRLAKETP